MRVRAAGPEAFPDRPRHVRMYCAAASAPFPIRGLSASSGRATWNWFTKSIPARARLPSSAPRLIRVTPANLVSRLRQSGLAGRGEVHLVPLRGGVSSDIHLVDTGSRRFVVKAALAKLRVRDEWFADVSRNAIEQAYLAYAARVVPEATPQVLAGHPDEGWFAMEYLGDGYRTWKERLMQGDAQTEHARRAGEVLGRLHRASWNEPVARRQFATVRNFHALRIDPYLLTSAARLPEARAALVAEANRLAATELALVHGEDKAREALAGEIGERFGVKVELARPGMTLQV